MTHINQRYYYKRKCARLRCKHSRAKHIPKVGCTVEKCGCSEFMYRRKSKHCNLTIKGVIS